MWLPCGQIIGLNNRRKSHLPVGRKRGADQSRFPQNDSPQNGISNEPQFPEAAAIPAAAPGSCLRYSLMVSNWIGRIVRIADCSPVAFVPPPKGLESGGSLRRRLTGGVKENLWGGDCNPGLLSPTLTAISPHFPISDSSASYFPVEKPPLPANPLILGVIAPLNSASVHYCNYIQ